MMVFSTMVNHGEILWFTILKYHGIPWFTMVYYGENTIILPWYTDMMVYHGKTASYTIIWIPWYPNHGNPEWRKND
jgi:hypothetical protein